MLLIPALRGRVAGGGKERDPIVDRDPKEVLGWVTISVPGMT